MPQKNTNKTNTQNPNSPHWSEVEVVEGRLIKVSKESLTLTLENEQAYPDTDYIEKVSEIYDISQALSDTELEQFNEHIGKMVRIKLVDQEAVKIL